MIYECEITGIGEADCKVKDDAGNVRNEIRLALEVTLKKHSRKPIKRKFVYDVHSPDDQARLALIAKLVGVGNGDEFFAPKQLVGGKFRGELKGREVIPLKGVGNGKSN